MVKFIRSSLLNDKTVGQLIKYCNDKINQHTKIISTFKEKKLHKSQRTYISRIKKKSKFLGDVQKILLKAPQTSIVEIRQDYARYQDLPKDKND